MSDHAVEYEFFVRSGGRDLCWTPPTRDQWGVADRCRHDSRNSLSINTATLCAWCRPIDSAWAVLMMSTKTCSTVLLLYFGMTLFDTRANEGNTRVTIRPISQ